MQGNFLLRVREVPLIRSIWICPIVFERVDCKLRHIAQPSRDNGDYWRRGDGTNDHAAIDLRLHKLLPKAHVLVTARQRRFPLVGQIPQWFDIVRWFNALRATTIVPFDPWSTEEWFERAIAEGREESEGIGVQRRFSYRAARGHLDIMVVVGCHRSIGFRAHLS